MERKKSIKTLSKKTGFKEYILKAARKVGFSDEQILNSSDEEYLKMLIRETDPKLAAELIPLIKKPFEDIKRPEPKEKPIDLHRVEYKPKTSEFEIAIMAGRPMREHARIEQEEIERQIRRYGMVNVEEIVIARSMKPNNHGRFISKVIIKYWRK